MTVTPADNRDALNTLLSRAESRRAQRAEDRPMTKVEWDGTAWHGECAGDERATQRSRITLAGRRSFNCTCTDKARMARKVGPCKHVISLAKAALENLWVLDFFGNDEGVVGYLPDEAQTA